jgi:hypothetical protein
MVGLDAGCSLLFIISSEIFLSLLTVRDAFPGIMQDMSSLIYVILHRHLEGFFSKGEIEKALKQLDDTG